MCTAQHHIALEVFANTICQFTTGRTRGSTPTSDARSTRGPHTPRCTPPGTPRAKFRGTPFCEPRCCYVSGRNSILQAGKLFCKVHLYGTTALETIWHDLPNQACTAVVYMTGSCGPCLHVCASCSQTLQSPTLRFCFGGTPVHYIASLQMLLYCCCWQQVCRIMYTDW